MSLEQVSVIFPKRKIKERLIFFHLRFSRTLAILKKWNEITYSILLNIKVDQNLKIKIMNVYRVLCSVIYSLICSEFCSTFKIVLDLRISVQIRDLVTCNEFVKMICQSVVSVSDRKLKHFRKIVQMLFSVVTRK